MMRRTHSVFDRCPDNPIVRPGLYDWRRAAVFNPGVVCDGDRFLLYERAAGQLRPFHCYIGALESDDGVHFRHSSDQPVFTPAMAGSEHGSVQDPRVVNIGGAFYMTYAFRPYAWNSHPTGVGVPESFEPEFPGFSGKPEDNQTRTGIAVSTDGLRWEHHCWATPLELDDRDVILFPDKVDGRFAILRRPLQFVGPEYGVEKPSIWLSFSDDLQSWSEPELLLTGEQSWESCRIGGSTPPIRTEVGWLTFYHGVEETRPETRTVIYRMGAVLLDLADPRRVLARTQTPLLEPRDYYECFGLYIPNVVFPTGAVIREGVIFLYYGVCDTAISLATAPVEAVVERVLSGA